MNLRSRENKLAKQLSTVHLIVIYYLIAIGFATILLSVPVFHNPGVDLSFIDTLFTAVSAISVTGLTAVSIADTFNVYGKLAITLILQLGGIGIMTLGTFIWILLGKKIGLRQRQLIRVDQNSRTLAGLVKLMLRIFAIVLTIELIGTIILSVYFLTYFDSWQEALLHGFFGAVSATTNAGFDITGASLIPFANDYFVQFINIILIILGAIGFPVLIEVQELLRGKSNGPNDKYNFSLFSKLTTFTFFGLVVAGWFLIYILERTAFLSDKAWHESFFYSLFMSVTSRSGGLTTMDVNEFTLPTLLLLCMLMFIGASPSSVGGGIRTTTFAIMLLAIYNYGKGNSSIKVFGREIDPEDVTRSFIVISTAMLLWSTSIILLASTETVPIVPIVFEVSSAFGTTGLSMGITPDLSVFGKSVIMVLMFIGRIGLFSFIFLIRGKETKDIYHYPKENVIIG